MSNGEAREGRPGARGCGSTPGRCARAMRQGVAWARSSRWRGRGPAACWPCSGCRSVPSRWPAGAVEPVAVEVVRWRPVAAGGGGDAPGRAGVEVASRSDAWSRCRSTRAMRCVVEVQVQQVEPVLLISAGLGYSTIVECWRCRSTGRCGCVVEVQGDAVAGRCKYKPRFIYSPVQARAGAGTAL